jgi:hypothetical protein
VDGRGNGLYTAPRAVEYDSDLLALPASKFALLAFEVCEEGGREEGTAHGAVDGSALLRAVAGPHLQALQVEVVAAAHRAPAEAHLRPHLLLADWTRRLCFQLHSLRYHYFALPPLLPPSPLARQYFFAHFFNWRPRTTRRSEGMSAREEGFELTVDVGGLPEERVV